MDRLIYSALSAMQGAMRQQTSLAHNLANVGTTGFRADMSVAQSLWLNGSGLDARAFASQQVMAMDSRAGAMTTTGRPLDIAMADDALLGVQAPNGDEAYTRRGDLQIAASGLLTTGDGHPVLGQQGPITLPPVESASIDRSGALWIVPVGGDPAIPQQLDRLKLVGPTGSEVVKGDDNLIRVSGGGVLPDDPDAQVASGQLEGSNVSATDTLVAMIEASRAWDAQMKLVTTARDIGSATSELMRLPG